MTNRKRLFMLSALLTAGCSDTLAPQKFGLLATDRAGYVSVLAGTSPDGRHSYYHFTLIARFTNVFAEPVFLSTCGRSFFVRTDPGQKPAQYGRGIAECADLEGPDSYVEPNQSVVDTLGMDAQGGFDNSGRPISNEELEGAFRLSYIGRIGNRFVLLESRPFSVSLSPKP